jgi:hypothetical protein
LFSLWQPAQWAWKRESGDWARAAVVRRRKVRRITVAVRILSLLGASFGSAPEEPTRKSAAG